MRPARILLLPAVFGIVLYLPATSSQVMLAQTITGSISGTIVDPSGASIPDAPVTLTNMDTGEKRETASADTGVFNFSALNPGRYSLAVRRSGFQSLQRDGIVLTANQRLALGVLSLTVGEVTQSVTVEQRGETVNLENADIGSVLSTDQVKSMPVRGRDPMNLLRILPGVSTLNLSQSGEIADGNAFGSNESLGGNVGSYTPTASGARLFWNTATVDGQVGSNPDWPGLFMAAVSMDGVSEVKINTNSYAAENGRNMGATIHIVSKSGTKELHGTAYWFKRHEQFNANDFFNNRAGIPKPLYRFNTIGGAIGGPIFIPKHFNQNRDKLFFFYSVENWDVHLPTGRTRLTVPTSLERGGNFSQTVDQNGALIVIRDPLANAPFPGNVIPSGRIDRNGQVLLNLLPQPNQLDRSLTRGGYNYEWLETLDIPKWLHQLRLDYRPTSNDTISITPRYWTADMAGYSQTRAFNNVPLLRARHLYSVGSVVVAWTRVLSPRMVNELNTGFTGEKERGTPNREGYFDPVDRTKLGFQLGQLYPQANPYNIIPQALYGGVPAAPNVTNDARLPKSVAYARYQIADNLSWNLGTHSVKLGIYMERNWATDGPASAAWNGVFDFSRDPNNPLESNWAFSNALLGNFRSYTESNRKSNYQGTNTLTEWFAQDVWKATRQLTLTYGLRFSWFRPWHLSRGEGVSFVSDRYDRTKMSPLIVPALDSAGRRVAMNPVTGELLPAVLIGAFTPGVGNPFVGLVSSRTPEFEGGFVEQRAVQVSPRLGLAYDVFGNGRTAIRGGFGITKQPTPSYGTYIGGTVSNQPVILSPQFFYNNMNALVQSQSGAAIFPGGEKSFDGAPKVPSVYQYSVGVQQQFHASMLLDVSFVGHVGRHLVQTQDLNTLPYGTRFLPSSADPTAPSRALPDSFLRPYLGYSSLPYTENVGTSSYNSLQVGLTRRFQAGVQFGIAYTWSKALGVGSSDGETLSRFISRKVWNYGLAYYDQTHMFIANYLWDLPRASKIAPNAIVRWAFDNWQFSGITNLSSGLPQGVGFTTVDNADITGGGDGVRPVVVAAVPLSSGERGFPRWFNTAAFARPAQYTFGNAAIRTYRGPGISNWDLNLAKNFPFRNEQRYLQFRAEFYNTLNQTQFQAVNSSARFDAAGQQVNGEFGQVVATRSPRVIQFGLRFTF